MLFNREPVMWMAALQALLALGIVFGANLSAEQVAGVMAAAAAILGLVARSQVSPVVDAPVSDA